MKRGFTLIEIVVTVAVVTILLAMILPYLPRVFQESRKPTLSDLENIKLGIMGEPTKVANKVRTSFGYFGDMGRLPSSLQDLLIQGSQPGYAYNQDLRVGAGWRGPYLRALEGNPGQFKPDAYGNAYIYDTTQYMSADTGGLVIGKIVSPGADLTANTSDDLKIEIFKSEAFGQISGLVKDQDFNYVPNVKVTINYPNNGILSSLQTVTDSNGRYVFSDIPFGNRSITIEPQLVYKSKSAYTKGGGTDLFLQVTNYATNAITINSLTAVYSSDPVAYFEEVLIGGVSLWRFQNFGNVRAASGQTIPFSSSKTLAGTNLPNETLMVSVHEPTIVLTDRVIGRFNQGQTITVRIRGFKDAQTGAGAGVDITGVPFQITFSDGSVASFIPVKG